MPNSRLNINRAPVLVLAACTSFGCGIVIFGRQCIAASQSRRCRNGAGGMALTCARGRQLRCETYPKKLGQRKLRRALAQSVWCYARRVGWRLRKFGGGHPGGGGGGGGHPGGGVHFSAPHFSAAPHFHAAPHFGATSHFHATPHFCRISRKTFCQSLVSLSHRLALHASRHAVSPSTGDNGSSADRQPLHVLRTPRASAALDPASIYGASPFRRQSRVPAVLGPRLASLPSSRLDRPAVLAVCLRRLLLLRAVALRLRLCRSVLGLRLRRHLRGHLLAL